MFSCAAITKAYTYSLHTAPPSVKTPFNFAVLSMADERVADIKGFTLSSSHLHREIKHLVALQTVVRFNELQY